MIYYFGFFAFVSAISFLCLDYRLTKAKYVLGILIVTCLAIFAGMRGEYVGSDYVNYKAYFYQFDSLFSGGFKQVIAFDYFFEPGFAFFISFVKIFTADHVVFFIVLSFSMLYIFLTAARKITSFYIISIFVYFCYLYFSHAFIAVRFGMASVIGLHCLIAVSERKNSKAFFLLVAALSFHTAAIALIVPLALSFFSIKRVHLGYGLLLSYVVGVFGLGKTVFLSALPSWVPRAESAAYYASDSQFGETLGLFGFINNKNAFILALGLFFWKHLITRVKYFETLMLFFFCGVTMRIAFHDLGFMISRLSALLTLVEVIILPAVIIHNIKQKLVAFLFLFLYSLMNIYMFIYVRGFPPYYSDVL